MSYDIALIRRADRQSFEEAVEAHYDGSSYESLEADFTVLGDAIRGLVGSRVEVSCSARQVRFDDSDLRLCFDLDLDGGEINISYGPGLVVPVEALTRARELVAAVSQRLPFVGWDPQTESEVTALDD